MARAVVSTLARAYLLHIPGAPSHATLHTRRIRDAVPHPLAHIAVSLRLYHYLVFLARPLLSFRGTTRKPCAHHARCLDKEVSHGRMESVAGDAEAAPRH